MKHIHKTNQIDQVNIVHKENPLKEDIITIRLEPGAPHSLKLLPATIADLEATRETRSYVGEVRFAAHDKSGNVVEVRELELETPKMKAPRGAGEAALALFTGPVEYLEDGRQQSAKGLLIRFPRSQLVTAKQQLTFSARMKDRSDKITFLTTDPVTITLNRAESALVTGLRMIGLDGADKDQFAGNVSAGARLPSIRVVLVTETGAE